MNTPFDFNALAEERLVYIRPVNVTDLPPDIQGEANGSEQVYALHSASGERLALVRERRMAFVLARQNDFAPVSVH